MEFLGRSFALSVVCTAKQGVSGLVRLHELGQLLLGASRWLMLLYDETRYGRHRENTDHVQYKMISAVMLSSYIVLTKISMVSFAFNMKYDCVQSFVANPKALHCLRRLSDHCEKI